MRRAKLFDHRMQLVTDRVDVPRGDVKAVLYRDRVFIHIISDTFIEVATARAIEWAEQSAPLPFVDASN